MTEPIYDRQRPVSPTAPGSPEVEYVVWSGGQPPTAPYSQRPAAVPDRLDPRAAAATPATWAPKPSGRPKTALLVAVVAAAAVAITAVVVSTVAGGAKDNSALGSPSGSATSASAPASGSGKPATASKSDLSAAQITGTLIVVGMQTKGGRLQNLTLEPDGTARFGVCADDATIEYFAVEKHGKTTPDGTEDRECLAGFITSDLSAGVLADVAAQNSADDPVALLVESWGTFTPTITILIDDDWGTEYDVAGNKLGNPINPLDLGARKEALTALVNASGISEAAGICVDIEVDAVVMTGNATGKGVETWQYTNLPQHVVSWPAAGTGRLKVADYDMTDQINAAQQVSDKYAGDGSKLAAICLDATYEPGTVRAVYLYSAGPDSEEYSHQVVADLDGTILEES